jgi:hypothetical protein
MNWIIQSLSLQLFRINEVLKGFEEMDQGD